MLTRIPLALILAAFAVAPATAQSPEAGSEKQKQPLVASINDGPFVSAPVVPQTSRPLIDVAGFGVPRSYAGYQINPRGKGRFTPAPAPGKRPPDALALESNRRSGARGPVPGPILTFEGMNAAEGCGGCQPPDPVLAVGPNHIVEMVNTAFSIYLKDGTRAVGPSQINALWAGQSGACAVNNAGDPIAVFDEMAGRWLLTQFFDDGICAAVSQTDDPTGAYHLYQFDFPDFPDYFKIGVWPSSYFVGANEAGYSAYAFDRASMIAGDPATFVRFADVSPNFVLPADVDGDAAPAAGSPGLFYTFLDSDFHGGGPDRLALYEFAIDWADPSAATFGLSQDVPITAYNYSVCGFFNFFCIPQGGTSQRVDAVSEWPMQRFIYRDFGSHTALAGTFTVDATGGGLAGLRWFELREASGGWDLYQEGTYAPADGLQRWMGSLAFSDAGALGIGYSASSSAERPSLRYTYRTDTDPLGAMLDEAVLVQGGGSQTGGDRWGDYSALAIDPADGETFWYVGEYVPSGSAWSTRIGAFRAVPAAVTLGLAVAPMPVAAGDVATLALTATAGPDNLGGVEVEAALPEGTAYVDGSATCGGAYDAGAEAVTFSVGALASRASQFCTFEARIDPSTSTPVFSLLEDDHEDGTDGWTAASGTGSATWSITTSNPFSGANAWFADDVTTVSDQRLTTSTPLALGAAPTLAFRHAYDLETGYDGGVVELSDDGGVTWLDLGTAITEEGYTTDLSGGANPIGGRPAFTGSSGGYVLTLVDLSAFAGESVLLRFRLGTDSSVGGDGWYVDDVRVFQGGDVAGTGTLTFRATVVADGDIAEDASASVLVTAETDCAVAAVSTDGPVSFDAPGQAVAARAVFAGVAGSGDVQICRVGAPSASAVGVEAGGRLGHFWTVQVEGGLQFSAASEFRFAVDEIPYSSIQNPSLLAGYARPQIGLGPFTAVPTTYSSGANELVVTGIAQEAALRSAFEPVAEITFAGQAGALPAEEPAPGGVPALALSAPAPNPIRDRAQLTFSVATAGPATLAVYDVLGREVARLFDGQAQPGQPYAATVEAAGLVPGTYIVRLVAEGGALTRRLTLVR